mmetsp:Transcript_9241/g.8170  ORF Transcript_9241/g.8170 Transcript_9241/m.8170 type:complete len:88 (-) Transcript_9241:440-703(-)
MEDTYIISDGIENHPENGLFCLFDGHAGKEVAQKLKRLFVAVFEKALGEVDNDKGNRSIGDAIRECFKKINKSFLKKEELKTIGSTA